MPRFVSTLKCLGMSPIIPINGTIIFRSVAVEFPADSRIVSVYPSCNLAQAESGTP